MLLQIINLFTHYNIPNKEDPFKQFLKENIPYSNEVLCTGELTSPTSKVMQTKLAAVYKYV